jgi:2-oxo-4-hydroxy-4-carboxy-5-ureidoimidazoline decarboxylase
MKIDQINTLDRKAFVEELGWIFEDSPWVAEQAWASRPFADIDQLHAVMIAAVENADAAQRLALLRAHPDLGTRARVSPASTSEQTGAGLDRLTPAELNRLNRMNAAYRDKFGFPFLLAVKGSTQTDILKAMESRLTATPESELGEALRQVYKIARFRLEEILTAPCGRGSLHSQTEP